METPPTDGEIEDCFKEKKAGKASGSDGVTAELIRYGGEEIKKRTWQIVKTLWSSATTAKEGNEADEWPLSWKKTIQIPLWKKKRKKRR